MSRLFITIELYIVNVLQLLLKLITLWLILEGLLMTILISQRIAIVMSTHAEILVAFRWRMRVKICFLRYIVLWMHCIKRLLGNLMPILAAHLNLKFSNSINYLYLAQLSLIQNYHQLKYA